MSEPVHTTETPATDAPEATPPAPEQAATPETPAEPKPTDTVEHWKRMSRENEAKAKANAAAAQKLKEIEDRDLSELERERRDRETAATENTTLKTELARLRVAVAKGLPADIAATLSGSNEDELAAHADALIAWRGNQPPPTPRPDPGQGPRPTSPQSEDDQLYEQMFGRG